MEVPEQNIMHGFNKIQDIGTEIVCAYETKSPDPIFHGTDYQHQDDYGRTTLHEAAYRGHEEIINLLLKGSTECHHQNSHGSNLVYEELCRSHENMVSHLRMILSQLGDNITLQEVVSRSHEDIVTLLLKERNISQGIREIPLLRSGINAYVLDKITTNREPRHAPNDSGPPRPILTDTHKEREKQKDKQCNFRGNAFRNNILKRNLKSDHQNGSGYTGSRVKRPKTERGCKTKPARKQFACPYFKKNPLKYSGCHQWKSTELSLLREHISRVHLKPVRCGRCGVFRGGHHEQITQHLMDENCEKSEVFESGIDIAREKAEGVDKANTWEEIYEVLFPLHIPDPSWHDSIEVLMSPIEDRELLFILRVRDAISFNKQAYQLGLAKFLENRLGLGDGAAQELLMEYDNDWMSNTPSQPSLLSDTVDYGRAVSVKYLPTQPHGAHQSTNFPVLRESPTNGQNSRCDYPRNMDSNQLNIKESIVPAPIYNTAKYRPLWTHTGTT